MNRASVHHCTWTEKKKTITNSAKRIEKVVSCEKDNNRTWCSVGCSGCKQCTVNDFYRVPSCCFFFLLIFESMHTIYGGNSIRKSQWSVNCMRNNVICYKFWHIIIRRFANTSSFEVLTLLECCGQCTILWFLTETGLQAIDYSITVDGEVSTSNLFVSTLYLFVFHTHDGLPWTMDWTMTSLSQVIFWTWPQHCSFDFVSYINHFYALVYVISYIYCIALFIRIFFYFFFTLIVRWPFDTFLHLYRSYISLFRIDFFYRSYLLCVFGFT